MVFTLSENVLEVSVVAIVVFNVILLLLDCIILLIVCSSLLRRLLFHTSPNPTENPSTIVGIPETRPHVF